MNYFYIKARRVAAPADDDTTWVVIAGSPAEAISLVPEDYVAQEIKIGAATYSTLKGVLGWMGVGPEKSAAPAQVH